MRKPLSSFPFYINQYHGLLSQYSLLEQGAFLGVLRTYLSLDGKMPEKERVYMMNNAQKNEEKIAIDFVYTDAISLGKEINERQQKICKTNRLNGKKGGKRTVSERGSAPLSERGGYTETYTETDTETNTDTKTNSVKTILYPDWFTEIIALYPKRQGAQNYKRALTAATKRLKEGFTEEELQCKAAEYQQHCNAFDKTNTEYVMMMSTFFNNTENLTRTWETKRNGRSNNKKSEFDGYTALTNLCHELEEQEHQVSADVT